MLTFVNWNSPPRFYFLEYCGKLVSGSRAIELEKEYAADKSLGSYLFYFDKLEWCLDATIDNGRFGRLVNHSKKRPNLKPIKHVHNNKPRIMFKAITDIEEGSELLYDYAETSRATIAALPWMKNS